MGANTVIFTEDDASGFPNTLPPARKIGLARRSLTGLTTDARKTGGDGPFESALERDCYALLEFDPSVTRWAPQEISVPGRGPLAAATYYPDVLVERANSPDIPTELCEVKYRETIRRDWRTLKTKFKSCRAFARERGWCFRILTEVEIRTPRLWNAKFLLPYIARDPELDEQRRLSECLLALGQSTPFDLLESLTSSKWERAALLPSLWALIGTRGVKTNLDEKLTMKSVISIDE